MGEMYARDSQLKTDFTKVHFLFPTLSFMDVQK
jgi:hypothetical protein